MEGNRKRKLFWGGVVLVAIVCLGIGWYFTLRSGVYVGDYFYYKVSETRYQRNRSNYLEFVSGDEVRIGLDEGEMSVSIEENGDDSFAFAFSNGRSVRGNWNGEDLVDSDGLLIGWSDVRIVTDDQSYVPGEAAICQAICDVRFGNEDTISRPYIAFLGVLVYVLGIVTILNPDGVHFFLSRWKYNNPELSEPGRLLEQIGGGFIVVIGIGIMTGALLLLV